MVNLLKRKRVLCWSIYIISLWCVQGVYLPVSPKKGGEGASEGVGEEEDEESMDWWTKYFASIDTMIEVSTHSQTAKNNN